MSHDEYSFLHQTMRLPSKLVLLLVVFLVLFYNLVFETSSVFTITKQLLVPTSYFVSTENNDASVATDPVENAWRIWNQYKQEHSAEALRKEVSLDNFSTSNSSRLFTVGYYSCPLQAGNRLHHFMNSMIWAVVTNRTLLWKYYDRRTCGMIGRMYSPKICQAANDETDCNQVLKRAEWLPALQEWVPYYNLSQAIPLSYWTTHRAETTHKFSFDGAEHHVGLADSISIRFVDFPQMLGQDSSLLRHKRERKDFLLTNQSRTRAELLFGAGVDFLYGLVFFESFTFRPNVTVPAILSTTINDAGTFSGNHSKGSDVDDASGVSVVLHSRHTKESDDGSSIKRERRCLEKILSNRTYEPCQVIILSDRPETIHSVTLHLNKHYPHCEPLVAPHDVGVSFSPEHGPFSGLGFYQDLAMVSNETRLAPMRRAAFVGSKRRSSSQLVREIMAYQLRPSGKNENRQELDTCYLEDVETDHKS